MRMRTAFVTATVGAAMFTGLAATPALATTEASGTVTAAAGCPSWKDRNTYGVACPGSTPYRAVAHCANGRSVHGAWRTHGRWSYAYCSSVGSSLRSGIVEYWLG